jgi:microcin C transport system permease protein
LPEKPESAINIEWNFPPEINRAILQRLANQSGTSIRVRLTNQLNVSKVADVSLSAFSPRREPPKDIRISFQEVSDHGLKPIKLIFNHDHTLVNDVPFWKQLNGAQQSDLVELARQSFAGRIEAPPVVINDVEYAVALKRYDIQWPFRPTQQHRWGIDSAGRDVFARILYGLRTSMTFGIVLVVFSMAFGILMGALQGYYGGKVDLVSQRLIEIWSTIPFLYVMIWLGAIYGRSFMLLLFCYGIFNWIGISYYVRAEFLRLRNAPFVDAARCLGISSSGIMFRHILPNSLTPIITLFPFLLVGAIGSLAVLDFLGFGLPPPTPSWGEILQQAQSFRWAWWLIVYSTAAIFSVILLGVFIGEGARDAYDPKPVTNLE